MDKFNKIILDNGHGVNTAGKRSPDGSFLEYEFNRAIVRKVLALAEKHDQQVDTFDTVSDEQKSAMKVFDKFIVLVPEEEDIPLGFRGSKYDSRVRRAEEIYKQDNNVLLLSIHANASGNGAEWKNGKGLAVFYDEKHGQKGKGLAKHFADIIYKYSIDTQIHEYGLNKVWHTGIIPTANKYSIIAFPSCLSLLLELGFFDNKEEVEYLKSEEGREELAIGIFRACISLLTDIKE